MAAEFKWDEVHLSEELADVLLRAPRLRVRRLGGAR